MNYSKKIKKIREKSGLTQKQFAEKLFVSRSLVAKWENDVIEPTNDNLEKIENIFNVKIDDETNIISKFNIIKIIFVYLVPMALIFLSITKAFKFEMIFSCVSGLYLYIIYLLSFMFISNKISKAKIIFVIIENIMLLGLLIFSLIIRSLDFISILHYSILSLFLILISFSYYYKKEFANYCVFIAISFLIYTMLSYLMDDLYVFDNYKVYMLLFLLVFFSINTYILLYINKDKIKKIFKSDVELILNFLWFTIIIYNNYTWTYLYLLFIFNLVLILLRLFVMKKEKVLYDNFKIIYQFLSLSFTIFAIFFSL